MLKAQVTGYVHGKPEQKHLPKITFKEHESECCIKDRRDNVDESLDRSIPIPDGCPVIDLLTEGKIS